MPDDNPKKKEKKANPTPLINGDALNVSVRKIVHQSVILPTTNWSKNLIIHNSSSDRLTLIGCLFEEELSLTSFVLTEL